MKIKEPSVLNLYHQWYQLIFLSHYCHVFAIHFRQCSILFSHSDDSGFLLGCNGITSFVL